MSTSDDENEEPKEGPSSKKVSLTPAQANTEKELHVGESKLNSLVLIRDSGLAEEGIEGKVKKMRDEVAALKRKLNSQKKNAEYQAKHRKKIKDGHQSDQRLQSKVIIFIRFFMSCINHLQFMITPGRVYFQVSTPGRPTLEEDQPELIRAITQIAMFGSQADERRRSQMIRTCRTLDDLHSALKEAGFTLPRSATYLRLLPRNSQTLEGKRHVKTAPVKLVRATTDLHKSHPDQHFCTASIRFVESLASLLGPDQVFFLSQVAFNLMNI